MPETKAVESVKWYTIKEAAKEAGVPYGKIRAAVSMGTILSKKIPDSSRYGYHYLIADHDLLMWVENPKAKRCEPIPCMKKDKPKKVSADANIEDLMKALYDKVYDHVYKEAYSKGFEDGKKAVSVIMESALKKIQ